MITRFESWEIIYLNDHENGFEKGNEMSFQIGTICQTQYYVVLKHHYQTASCDKLYICSLLGIHLPLPSTA